jgi:hypothetical protein
MDPFFDDKQRLGDETRFAIHRARPRYGWGVPGIKRAGAYYVGQM